MGIDVVRSLIARFVKLFAGQHVPVSVTGTAAETTLFSTVIPGGTIGPNGRLDILALASQTNLTNLKTLKIKFGGVVFWNTQLGAYLSAQVPVFIRNRNAQNAQVSGVLNSGNPWGYSSAAGVFTAAVDTSIDQTLAVTGVIASPTVTKSAAIARSGQTATATVTAHGYANGNSVLMSGATQTEYNGTFVISNVTANTFDYTVTGTPSTPATGTPLAALWDTITCESVDVEVKTGW